jgi:hypothetical protein
MTVIGREKGFLMERCQRSKQSFSKRFPFVEFLIQLLLLSLFYQLSKQPSNLAFFPTAEYCIFSHSHEFYINEEETFRSIMMKMTTTSDKIHNAVVVFV